MTDPINTFGTREWVEENRNRQVFIEWLYAAYKRDDAPLGTRNFYTGLYQRWAHGVLHNVRESTLELAAGWKD